MCGKNCSSTQWKSRPFASTAFDQLRKAYRERGSSSSSSSRSSSERQNKQNTSMARTFTGDSSARESQIHSMRATPCFDCYPHNVFDSTEFSLLLMTLCLLPAWSYASPSSAVATINGGISDLCRVYPSINALIWLETAAVSLAAHTQWRIGHTRISLCRRCDGDGPHNGWSAFGAFWCAHWEEKKYSTNTRYIGWLWPPLSVSLILGACVLCDGRCARESRKQNGSHNTRTEDVQAARILSHNACLSVSDCESAFASRDDCLASHENDKNTLAIFSTSVLSFFPLAIFLLQSTLVNWFSSWDIGRETLRCGCCRRTPRHCCWCCRRCCCCCFFASSATAFVCVMTYYCSIFEECRPFEMKMRGAEKGEREWKRGTSNYCARIIPWACRSKVTSSGRILTTHNNDWAGRRNRRNFAAEIVFLQIFITFNRWRHFFFWFCDERV